MTTNENYKTHTILKPSECKCNGMQNCRERKLTMGKNDNCDSVRSHCSSSAMIKNEIHKAKSGRYDALWDDDRTEGYIGGLKRALELLEPEWESLPESTGGFFVGWDNSEPPQLWVWRNEPGDETAEAWQKIVY